jgi:hypothetical protein
MLQVEMLWRPNFLSEGLRILKKIDHWRTPLAKNVAMWTTMTFLHLCLKFSTGEVLAIAQTPVSEEPIL